MISDLHGCLPYFTDGMRIGLFGGFFNPAHAGHRFVALSALRLLSLDRVWWVVSRRHILKHDISGLDFMGRVLSASKQAYHPRMSVISVESMFDIGSTSALLRYLSPVLRRGKFVWIMGSDSFSSLHLWKSWHDLPESLPLAIFPRYGSIYSVFSCPAGRYYADHRFTSEVSFSFADYRAPAWIFLPMRLHYERSRFLRSDCGM